MNLAALVSGHRGDSRALYDGARWLTWDEVRGRSASLAELLAAEGVGPGDRVGIVWPTSTEFVVSYLATLASGAVAVPLNPNSPPAELARELEAVAPAVVLAAPGTAPADVLGVPVLGAHPQGGHAEWKVAEREADDLAVLLYTSGTAGAPRAAMLSHGNLSANLEQMLALPGEIARRDDIGLAAVPLFHIFGLNVALGLVIATGGALVLEERFDPAGSLGLVHDLGVTSLVGAPTMFAAWADLAEGNGAAHFDGVRRAISGAAALEPEVAARFEARFGIPLWQGYGLTEASPAVATSLGTGRNRPGSVGRPLPGVEVRIVDDSGTEVLQGDPGEIWVRGPNVFRGYWGDPASTAEVLGPDGWLRTGDIGIVGEDGDLYVVDRRKDLVIVSGFNVFPGEVESVARSVPGVADAVVVGRPDPRTGESVELVVVRAPGGTVEADDVVAACRKGLARYKCPTSVRFVDELPRGVVGKALRRMLRDEPPG